MAPPNTNNIIMAVKRVRLWYGLLILVITIFAVRLFYVQVINYGHYKTAALSDQLKQYEIPAARGTIKAYEGEHVLPIVLNQKLYTLYADPGYIKKPAEAAAKLVPIIGGKAENYQKLMETKNTRYVVLAKKLPADKQKKIAALKYPGLGTQAVSYRTYPQGSLASQLLGFVDDNGSGRYGLEQALNHQLAGRKGQLKAITDINGVPLAASRDNTEVTPEDGQDVVLTIDLAMQQKLETILSQGSKNAIADGASAVIMDAKTGAIKAMANYPSYDPSNYFKVRDASVFQNGVITKAIEVGSTMKTLTTAAALDQGVIRPETTYYDPSSWVVDKFRITNIEEDGGAGTRSVADILNLSLNSGATWELMRMGGGQINPKARQAWYEYLANRYRFGKATGIEQGYEASGYVPAPKDNGAGINLTYANMSFGQAMTATPIQMAAALAAVVNGGTYYQPRLVDKLVEPDGTAKAQKPKVARHGVVSRQTSRQIIPLMENVIRTRITNHVISPAFDQSRYIVGGKTGTAQIAKPAGGYYEHLFNGTYAGIVGGDEVQYVIVVFVDKPKIGGYAGTAAAQPIFVNLAHMLINDSYAIPRSH